MRDVGATGLLEVGLTYVTQCPRNVGETCLVCRGHSPFLCRALTPPMQGALTPLTHEALTPLTQGALTHPPVCQLVALVCLDATKVLEEVGQTRRGHPQHARGLPSVKHVDDVEVEVALEPHNVAV